MTLVVDASVACKWFFEEILSTEARALARPAAVFSAPDMILVECANAAWRRMLANTELSESEKLEKEAEKNPSENSKQDCSSGRRESSG